MLAQENHAIHQGEFTLRSGQKSSFYLDAITLALNPEAADLIARALVQHAREAGATVIAGPRSNSNGGRCRNPRREPV